MVRTPTDFMDIRTKIGLLKQAASLSFFLHFYQHLLESVRKVKFSFLQWYFIKWKYGCSCFLKSRIFILISVISLFLIGCYVRWFERWRNDVTFNKAYLLPPITDQRTIQLLKRATNTPNNSFTRLHVVEEHHEALPLWLRRFYETTSSDNPHFNQSLEIGNVALIHIDAHIDLGNPDVSKKRTFKKWPQKMLHLIDLLQGNDRFIIPTFALGLFSDFLWIHPHWSRDENHILGNFFTGYVKGKESSELKMCTCTDRKFFLISEDEFDPDEVSASKVSIDPRSLLNTPYWHRFFQDPSLFILCMVEKNSEEVIFSASDGECELRTSVSFEVASEIAVANITMLMTRYKTPLHELTKTYPTLTEKSLIVRLINPSSSSKPLKYILDIDEDYFGVEVPGWVLNKTGVDQSKALTKVNEQLASVFCSYDGAKTEKEFHLWFQKNILTHLFLETWKCWENEIKECEKFSSAFKSMKEEIMKEPRIKSWKCIPSNETVDLKMQKAFKSLWRFLRDLNQRQLTAVISLGICMSESAAMSRLWRQWVTEEKMWNELFKDKRNSEVFTTFGMQLCVGKNAPGSEWIVERKIQNVTM
jgi:hypothetical protein